MIHYSFSTTVALISGAQRYDKCVAAFAKNLKQVNPTVSIIGSVG